MVHPGESLQQLPQHRGCHLLERLYQAALAPACAGVYLGSSSQTWGRNRQQMCSGGPGITPSPQGSPEEQSCHPVSSSGQGTNSMSSLLPLPPPKDAEGQNHHFIQPTASSLPISGAPGTPGSLANRPGSAPNLTPAAHPREGPIVAAQEVL